MKRMATEHRIIERRKMAGCMIALATVGALGVLAGYVGGQEAALRSLIKECATEGIVWYNSEERVPSAVVCVNVYGPDHDTSGIGAPDVI